MLGFSGRFLKKARGAGTLLAPAQLFSQSVFFDSPLLWELCWRRGLGVFFLLLVGFLYWGCLGGYLKEIGGPKGRCMCTILILKEVHPEFPLIIAANRDEYYSRASTPPVILHRAPRIIGGKDQEKGGTWMAVSANGRFAGLTNQRTGALPDKNRKSRGEAVLDALKAPTVEEAAQHLARQRPKDFNPFNLIFGDARTLKVAYCHDENDKILIEDIPKGFSVLPNDTLNSPKFWKVSRAKELAQRSVEEAWPGLSGVLTRTISDHTLPEKSEVFAPKGSWMPMAFWRKLESLCIHTPVYGTRSSTLAAFTYEGCARYLFADGAPCKTPFVDYSHLLL